MPPSSPPARPGSKSGTLAGVKLPLVVLVGPTATGKSRLAVDLALALSRTGTPAEIVNADSMLVYRGMDIGTAKPTVDERRGVPHHLIDILEVTQTATVADFQGRARAALADCRSRGVVPILVGGSSLYMRAILDRFDFPGTDPDVRSRWEAELVRVGPEQLHAHLATLSAEAAREILPQNGRRIVRALEVFELTGEVRPTLPEWTYEVEGVIGVGLELPREEMDRRVAERVDAMWAAGFVDEVRGLLPRGLRDGLTARRALGYRQVLAYLDGDLTEVEARAETVARTRRFARKQLGWFRRDHRITWFGSSAVDVDDLASRVLAAAGTGDR